MSMERKVRVARAAEPYRFIDGPLVGEVEHSAGVGSHGLVAVRHEGDVCHLHIYRLAGAGLLTHSNSTTIKMGPS